jgi:ABC-type glycerol-3-phosphate transport system substrate-binding protein
MLASITNSISKFSKNKDAAWSFISFLSSPRIEQAIFNAKYGSLIRTSTLNNDTNKKTDPYTFAYLGWLANAVPAGTNLGAPVVAERILPAVPRSPDFVNIVVQQLAGIFAGTTSITDGLNKAQSDATDLMKSTGLYK